MTPETADSSFELPDAKSSNLYLAHPTEDERVSVWTLNGASWKGALSLPDYLEREQHLLNAPLAKNGGITHWVLVDKSLPPNSRSILASCETLRKRAFISRDGKVTETISHGIGSVFCDPRYRGKGYASRMLTELGKQLRTWQIDTQSAGGQECPFSFLYSDIGKKYYAGHGWLPFPSKHLTLPPDAKDSSKATPLKKSDLPDLCKMDERYIRKSLERLSSGMTGVALIPDEDQMGWHHRREDFLCQKIFGKTPDVKGAIIGDKGSRVWAIWTRSLYGPVEQANSGNTLHIIRLVLEDERNSEENAEKLKAVLGMAQSEAKAWSLLHVELWNPSKVVEALVIQTELEHSEVEREDESITSLMWYGSGSGSIDHIDWLCNEKYGWC